MSVTVARESDFIRIFAPGSGTSLSLPTTRPLIACCAIAEKIIEDNVIKTVKTLIVNDLIIRKLEFYRM